MLLPPIDSPKRDRTELYKKANISKEKVKTKLFPLESVLELNTKNLGNSPSFLTITHMTPSAKQFRSHDISRFNFTAEFCFWTEQWLNGTQVLGLRLTETSEVPNLLQ
jgi:hypothetical protein